MKPKNSNLLNTLKFTFKHISSKVVWLYIFLVLSAYVFAGRALPIVFGKSVDQGILSQNKVIFLKLALYFLVFSLLRSVFGFLLYYLIGVESNKIAYNVRELIYKKVLRLPTEYFDKNSSGKILTRVTNDTNSFKSFLGEGFIGIFINFFELASIFVALVYESYLLSSVVLLILPVVYFISRSITKKLETSYFNLKSQMSDINSTLADSLNGFSVIRGHKLFKQKQKEFKKDNTKYLSQQLEISKFFAYLWPQIEFVQLLIIFLSFLIGAYAIPKGLIEPGTLVAYTLLVQSVFHPLRFILERLNQIQNGITSAKRIIDVVDEKEETQPHVDLDKTPLPKDFHPEVSIKNLSFSYDLNNSDPIFNDLNLIFKANETTALVGRTGCGKTTLISLLQRLYTAQTGAILIDGHDINSIPMSSLRESCCVVRQEDFVFQGSILENITLEFSKKQNLIKAQQALEFSGISKPLTFDVTTSGENLSPGERQLLSFARVFYHSPKILVFDEATSFIDEKTEQEIQKKAELLFKNKTVIIVAHKKSTIEMCENIINLG